MLKARLGEGEEAQVMVAQLQKVRWDRCTR
jgi:hypothetical protein